MASPRLAVVLCTYNRAPLLRGVLDALAGQTADPSAFEVIVVDNNSSDDTAAVVAGYSGLRYIRESRQGLAHARNAGILATRADLIAFTDDDVRPDPDWIAELQRAEAAHPDAAWFGGKVLPVWPAPPPAWLTPAFWPPLALVDYGDAPFETTAAARRCLVGANLAVRRSTFDRVGLFSADVQRVRDGLGSTEDHELQLRCWQAGLAGVYWPGLVVRAPVQPDRLEPAYHRRWHAGHGRFYAIMREPLFESTRRGRWLDVPLHVFRAIGAHGVSAALAGARRDWTRGFFHELQARFLVAYAFARLRREGRARERRIGVAARSTLRGA